MNRALTFFAVVLLAGLVAWVVLAGGGQMNGLWPTDGPRIAAISSGSGGEYREVEVEPESASINLQDMVDASDIIARVIIAEIQGPLFANLSGARPTADTTNPDDLTIFRPLVATVAESYRKPDGLDVDTMVMSMLGGSRENVDFRNLGGLSDTIGVGDEGLLFASTYPAAITDNLQLYPIEFHITGIADGLNGDTVPAYIETLYRYRAGSAESLVAKMPTMTVQDLETQVQQILGQ